MFRQPWGRDLGLMWPFCSLHPWASNRVREYQLADNRPPWIDPCDRKPILFHRHSKRVRRWYQTHCDAPTGHKRCFCCHLSWIDGRFLVHPTHAIDGLSHRLSSVKQQKSFRLAHVLLFLNHFAKASFSLSSQTSGDAFRRLSTPMSCLLREIVGCKDAEVLHHSKHWGRLEKRVLSLFLWLCRPQSSLQHLSAPAHRPTKWCSDFAESCGNNSFHRSLNLLRWAALNPVLAMV